MTLPDLVIAGVNKAGTTTLFDALATHPDVASSSVKETCYWLPLRYDEPLAPLHAYEQFFADAPMRPVTVEATPGYFYGGAVIAPALLEVVPDVKVLIALREPVGRLRSFFRFQQAMLALDPDLSIDEYVRTCLTYPAARLVADRSLNPWFGVEGGRYDRYLPPWIELFGDRLKVVYFEDLASNQHDVLVDVGTWLGLDPAGWAPDSLSVSNRTVTPRNRRLHGVALSFNRRFEAHLRELPRAKSFARRVYQRLNTDAPTDEISADVVDELRALYDPHNRALAELLARHALVTPAWSVSP